MPTESTSCASWPPISARTRTTCARSRTPAPTASGRSADRFSTRTGDSGRTAEGGIHRKGVGCHTSGAAGARELTTGPGSIPMAQAGQAWGGLAAGLGEAVVEYESIIGDVRQAWQSGTGDAVAERITALRDWLIDAAAGATANAAKAEVQAT